MMGGMKLKALTLALLLVLSVAVLSACGGGDDTSTAEITSLDSTQAAVDPADIKPYPQDVVDEFLKSCGASSNGNKSLCECIIKAYEDTLPLDQYQEIASPKPGEVPPTPPDATRDAANRCAVNHT
jgi:hypothetical protein